MDSTSRSVKMIVDAPSLETMLKVGAKMGVDIEVLAESQGRYSYRDGAETSIVPEGSKFVRINAGNQIGAFWDLVCKEKNKQREAWLAANPQQAS